MIKDGSIAYNDSIKNVCKILENKVYETEVDFKDIEAFRNNYFSLAERQENERMKVRFIWDEKSEKSWTSVSPNLEDVFLYIYKDDNINDEINIGNNL